MIRVDTPKFKVPFRLSPTGEQATVIEQDSVDEVAQCVEAVLRTYEGSRLEEPEFGIPDLTFSQGKLDLTGIERAIAEWEARASTDLTEEEIEAMIRRVVVNVNVRKEADIG